MMRLTMVGFAVAAATLACAQRAPLTVSQRANDEAEVRRVENEIIAAENRGDLATFDRLLAPDWTFVNPGGGVFDKARYMRLVRTDSLHSDSYTVD
jgi:hypothetical protein